MDPTFPPERFHRLQVRLDRLRAASDACRRALADLAEGQVSRGDFERVLEAQRSAHRAWVRENEDGLADA